MQLFTPIHRPTGKRLRLKIEETEIPRGYRWRRKVKDKDGNVWRAWGKSCGIPNCFCDSYALLDWNDTMKRWSNVAYKNAHEAKEDLFRIFFESGDPQRAISQTVKSL